MEVAQYTRSNSQKTIFITVSRLEAIALIQSLSTQLLKSNSNTGRLESTTVNGEYFSISVVSE
jgi:hypothetical protein